MSQEILIRVAVPSGSVLIQSSYELAGGAVLTPGAAANKPTPPLTPRGRLWVGQGIGVAGNRRK